MEELEIKNHDFEKAKEEIKNFSEQTSTDIELKKVKNSKSVGEFFSDWFWGRGIGTSHLVKGSELSELTTEFATIFQSINDTQIKLIKEFGQVYSALEALDKDYIQAILISIEATKETSKGVKNAQDEIRGIVGNQETTVEILKNFKKELDGYAHLRDIDKIWSDYKTIQDGIKKLSTKTTEDIATNNNKKKNSSKHINKDASAPSNEAKLFIEFFSDLSKKLEDTADLLDNQISAIQEAYSFTKHLKTVDHIEDIDCLWNDLDVCKANINDINKSIQIRQNALDSLATSSAEHKKCIDTLFEKLVNVEECVTDSKNLLAELEDFRSEVSALSHLMGVDEIWEQTENHKTRIKNIEQDIGSNTDKLKALEQTNDSISERINSNKLDISILKEYKDKMSSISHLDDVDKIWEDVDVHTSKLVKCEKRDEELDAAIEFLTKKVKYAYWVAGGSAGLAIIELILLLIKVI